MKRKNIVILISALMFQCANYFAQKPKNHIAFINGVVHVGNGIVYETGIVAFQNDKLEMVSDMKGIRLNPSVYDTVIDLQGKHVYPALINPNNILGITEIEQIRSTLDFREVGQLNSHVRSLIAYNTDSKVVATIKTNGVLYTQVTPQGDLITGSSSIVALEGWNWEDAVLKADDGMHLVFPKEKYFDWSEETGLSLKKNKYYNEQLNSLQNFFDDARAYCLQTSISEKNIRFEAMRSLFNGTQRLYIHADQANELLASIQFSQKNKIQKIVLAGASDAHKIAPLLVKYKIPVVLGTTHNLPNNDDDDVDAIFKLPAQLLKDSVLFCLSVSGGMEHMQSRNLPFIAGSAASYGLTKEQALQAVTLNTAKIMGIDSKLGSLETGKLASLVITEGDILDMKSSNVIMAYIAGNAIDLKNEQTELYEKYKTKYGIK